MRSLPGPTVRRHTWSTPSERLVGDSQRFGFGLSTRFRNVGRPSFLGVRSVARSEKRSEPVQRRRVAGRSVAAPVRTLLSSRCKLGPGCPRTCRRSFHRILDTLLSRAFGTYVPLIRQRDPYRHRRNPAELTTVLRASPCFAFSRDKSSWSRPRRCKDDAGLVLHPFRVPPRCFAICSAP